MVVLLNNAKYAESLGISPQAVSKAIINKLIHKGKKGINPGHPINQIYAERVKKRGSKNSNISKTQTKRAAKKREALREHDESIFFGEETRSSTQAYDLDDKKKIEDTRLKRIQADKAAVDYAERLNVVVDDVSLFKLFGLFYDHLLNDLIYLPESIADILVNVVKSSDDPRAAVVEELKKAIKSAIGGGKSAIKKLKPPKKGRRYVLKKIKKV